MNAKYLVVGVTGAAGFIGSYLCKSLVETGFTVLGVDNLSKGNLKNLEEIKNHKNFIFKKTDISSLNQTKKSLGKCDVIVHLAAAKIPRYGERIKTLKINTKSTENILEIAKSIKAKVIFASTSDVYGKNPKIPFSEESDLVLGSPEVARWAYATSKIFDEHLCYAYWEEYKVPFVIIRFFGVYGPKQHRSWWGGPQALFIDKVLNGEEIEIHGDGLQTRTFIYIDDVIEALVKVITSKKADNQILNIGTTKEISVINLAKLISKIARKDLKLKKVPYSSFTGNKYEDVRRRVPSLSKAMSIISWKPQISLESGLKRTIEWHLKNPL